MINFNGFFFFFEIFLVPAHTGQVFKYSNTADIGTPYCMCSMNDVINFLKGRYSLQLFSTLSWDFSVQTVSFLVAKNVIMLFPAVHVIGFDAKHLVEIEQNLHYLLVCLFRD